MVEALASDYTESEFRQDEVVVRVRYHQLLKYAPPFEIGMFIIGVVASALIGVSTQLSFLLFSSLVDDFSSPTQGGFKTTVQRMAMLGAVTFLVAYMQMFCLQFCARR
ncbi:unnamed protein product, partial [Taenia asiatica]|uniref:ABC transmembrane type-1 domain-containing protein n=1 Tax=Taenia asiatica TaxID=60517 RepID=A0A0R3WH79_TAEAS